MRYRVVAKQCGDSVEYRLDASALKDALVLARQQADSLFGYMGIGERPTVSVRPLVKSQQPENDEDLEEGEEDDEKAKVGGNS